jgi:hypothetical protein
MDYRCAIDLPSMTKAEVWDRILSDSKEKLRPISWTRLVETAMPVVGVLEKKGVKPHGEGEGIYRID